MQSRFSSFYVIDYQNINANIKFMLTDEVQRIPTIICSEKMFEIDAGTSHDILQPLVANSAMITNDPPGYSLSIFAFRLNPVFTRYIPNMVTSVPAAMIMVNFSLFNNAPMITATIGLIYAYTDTCCAGNLFNA